MALLDLLVMWAIGIAIALGIFLVLSIRDAGKFVYNRVTKKNAQFTIKWKVIENPDVDDRVLLKKGQRLRYVRPTPKNRIFTLAIMLTIVLLAYQVQYATIPGPVGVRQASYLPVEDTYVTSDSPTSAYGSDLNMYVGATYYGAPREPERAFALLRHNATSETKSMSLRLWQGSGTSDVVIIYACLMDLSWDERTATWNSTWPQVVRALFLENTTFPAGKTCVGVNVGTVGFYTWAFYNVTATETTVLLIRDPESTVNGFKIFYARDVLYWAERATVYPLFTYETVGQGPPVKRPLAEILLPIGLIWAVSIGYFVYRRKRLKKEQGKSDDTSSR